MTTKILGDATAGLREIEAAIRDFESADDATQMADATLAVVVTSDLTIPIATRRRMAERALAYGERLDGHQRALLHLMAAGGFGVADTSSLDRLGADSAAQAARLAAALGLDDVKAMLHLRDALVAQAAGQISEARRLTAMARDYFDRTGDWAKSSAARFNLAAFAVSHEEWLSLSEERREFDRRAGYQRSWLSGIAVEALFRLLARGEVRQTRELLASASPRTFYFLDLAGALLREYEGDVDEALRLVPTDDDPRVLEMARPILSAARLRFRHLRGDRGNSGPDLRAVVDSLGSPETATWVQSWVAAFAVDALAAWAPGESFSLAMQMVRENQRRSNSLRIDTFCRERAEGLAAMGLGDAALARSLFAEGLTVCREERCRAEEVRCLLDLAQLFRLRGESSRAHSMLDEAAHVAREISAVQLLHQVIARKVELQGLTSEDMHSSIVALNRTVQTQHPDLSVHAAPDGTVTLLFSDIENSTALNEQIGDAKWMALLRAHNAVIDAQVDAHDGHVVKTMGDGYMVAFKSAADGLKCAIAIQKALGPALTPGPSPDATGEGSLAPVRVRIGLHTGEMVREGDDFFGRHVNLAARVAGHASGGEIFVSGVVRDLVSGQAFAFDDAGERAMKGFEQPVRVWAARWA